VLREMGVAQPELDFPVRAIRQVISKHRDLPGGIVFRLPELMSDPEFVIRHRDGGLNVVISERTPSGEPIVVGVREGRIRTITPIHNNEAESGAERLAAKIAADIQSGASVYRKNKAPDLTGASAPQQVRNNRDGLKNRANENVLSLINLVNTFGEEFSQPQMGFEPCRNLVLLMGFGCYRGCYTRPLQGSPNSAPLKSAPNSAPKFGVVEVRKHEVRTLVRSEKPLPNSAPKDCAITNFAPDCAAKIGVMAVRSDVLRSELRSETKGF